jgi:hypothetical protein
VFALRFKMPPEQTGAFVDITGLDGAVVTRTETESIDEPQELLTVR